MAFAYLGAAEKEVHRESARLISKATIVSRNTTKSIVDEVRPFRLFCDLLQILRNLLNVDKVRRMKPGKVICMITGYQPLYDDCYDISAHPNYPLLESEKDPAKP